MADTGNMLILTSTSSGKQLGSIRLENGAAVFEGAAEQIFRSRQRAAGEDMSDEDLYNWYAEGWSNGPLAIGPADTTSTAPTEEVELASPDSP